MGLLDSVLGQVLGGAAQKSGGLGDAGGLADALGGLLANNGQQGGLGGLVSKFEQAGLGDVIGSWIGKGDNAPVSGGQLNQVLGGDVVSAIAGKLGINAAMLLPMLATMLPSLIDQLTPHGKIPDEGLNTNEDLLSSLSGLLQKR
ncbi:MULTISPECIES: YidB family protein [Variovorax]|jgi:uncharacterized protein YidB (DUF937 family)|uniref:YidB family protein n=1 Tax=Variovorax TaxID=34072 RepID=UPI0016019A6E|nr:YidB family protein [Variovorax sp. UMC13]MBB1604200.1 hypothetical protein [Variovorax sp. UMC13]